MLQTLDTIISIVFVFLMFSLVVSAAAEMIAVIGRRRGRTLKQGIDLVLTNLGKPELVAAFWNHPFIKAVHTSDQPPSYIPSSHLAAALLHLAAGSPAGQAADLGKLKGALTGLPHEGLATVIATAIEQSGANASLAQVQASLEGWVDAAMERISSLYARRTRTWLFLVAFVAAVAMNIDTITIWQQVQSDKALRDSLVAQATKAELPPDLKHAMTNAVIGGPANRPAEDRSMGVELPADLRVAIDQYQQRLSAFAELRLPLGWTEEAVAHYQAFWSGLTHAFGILASALAASLGAPFWFDLLQRFMNIRSALKPTARAAPGSPTGTP